MLARFKLEISVSRGAFIMVRRVAGTPKFPHFIGDPESQYRNENLKTFTGLFTAL